MLDAPEQVIDFLDAGSGIEKFQRRKIRKGGRWRMEPGADDLRVTQDITACS